jgi:hypothetical protein
MAAITPKLTLLHQLQNANHYGDDNEEEEEEEDEAQHRQKRRRVLVVVWVEIMCRREEQIQQRNMHRTYLTRPDINPSPCIGTPWQHMCARGNDRAFITTMGIDVATFEYLLDQGFAEAWNSTPIPCNDVSLNGFPRVWYGLVVIRSMSITMRKIDTTWSVACQWMI